MGHTAVDGVLDDHEPDDAGALMVSHFPTVAVNQKVEAARERLREFAGTWYGFTHIFVVEAGGELTGQVSMIELAMFPDATPIRSLTTSVLVEVSVDTPREECIRLHRQYNVTQLPVVEDGKLIGVIRPNFC